MINLIKQYMRPRSEWFPYQHLILLAGVIYAITLPVATGSRLLVRHVGSRSGGAGHKRCSMAITGR